MKFQKTVLKLAVAALMVSSHAYADDNGWGDVAGSDSADVGGWSAPAAPQAEPGKLACGADDPRYATLVPVLKSLQAGEKIEPMQTSFSTYVSLSQNVRAVLGENIFISSSDCSEQYLFNGELTGKVNVPLAELWQVTNDAIRSGDQGLLQFVYKNTRAAPESAQSIISMTQFVHLDDAQVRKLYSVIAPNKANSAGDNKPLMLEVFVAYGGTVTPADRGKAVYIASRHNSIIGMHLERQGGSNEQTLRFDGVEQLVTSLFSGVGLRVEAGLTGNEAKRLGSQ